MATLYTCNKNKPTQFLISDEDFEKVSAYKWYLDRKGYIVRHQQMPNNTKKTIMLGRFILGPETNEQVDHKNRNPLDNTRTNLRLCTPSQNMINQGVRKNSTSGIKGVIWVKTRKKWMACIKVNKKRIYLGLFVQKEEAKFAYNQKAKEVYGDFAFLNP